MISKLGSSDVPCLAYQAVSLSPARRYKHIKVRFYYTECSYTVFTL